MQTRVTSAQRRARGQSSSKGSGATDLGGIPVSPNAGFYVLAVLAFLFMFGLVNNAMHPQRLSARDEAASDYATMQEGWRRYYTGCELPGAVKNCAKVMKDADTNTLTEMGSMPAAGPTLEIKMKALKEQDRISEWAATVAEHEVGYKELEAMRQKLRDALAKRAGQ